MVRLSGELQRDGTYRYTSRVTESLYAGQTSRTFDDEDEMRTIMEDILASQPTGQHIEDVLGQVNRGGYYWFYGDLELTEAQAQALGWVKP